ncbi:MAG: hypothetical protein SwStaBPW_28500 [Shewanella algae]
MCDFESMRKLASILGVACPESNDNLFSSRVINNMIRSTKRLYKEKQELKVFHVVYHTKSHECTCDVIAHNRLDAANSVRGTVMHVDTGKPLSAGEVLGDRGWNLSFKTPEYKCQSESWSDYLKSVNLYLGFEDR